MLPRDFLGALAERPDVRVHVAHDVLRLLSIRRSDLLVVGLFDLADLVLVLEILEGAENAALVLGQTIDAVPARGERLEVLGERCVAAERADARPEERNRSEQCTGREHEKRRTEARREAHDERDEHRADRETSRDPASERSLGLLW